MNLRPLVLDILCREAFDYGFTIPHLLRVLCVSDYLLIFMDAKFLVCICTWENEGQARECAGRKGGRHRDRGRGTAAVSNDGPFVCGAPVSNDSPSICGAPASNDDPSSCGALLSVLFCGAGTAYVAGVFGGL